MSHTIINPDDLHDPQPFGYSHTAGIPAGTGLVVIAGQYGSGPDGTVVSNDFAEQVRQAFDNLGLKSVVVDTSICIYFLDGDRNSQRHEIATRMFQLVEEGALTAIVSPITVAELLVHPMHRRDVRAKANVRLFVARLCEVSATTIKTASYAAEIRARHRMRTPDSFILQRPANIRPAP